MAKKRAAKKATSTRKAARKYSAKSAARAAKRHSASPSKTIAVTPVTREPKPYAIHLSFQAYQDFAKAMTTSQPGLPKPYYLGNKVDIQNFIEYQLIDLGAKVLTDCSANPRDFDANDNIKVEIDHGGSKQYRISIPAMICEKPDGKIDIDYLRQYVTEIRNPATSIDDAAYALLGMYFLSRCR